MNNQNSIDFPEWYTRGGIETIDFIRSKLTKDQFIGYCKGTILAYVSRAGFKGNEEDDYRKAMSYLQWVVQELNYLEMEETGCYRPVTE